VAGRLRLDAAARHIQDIGQDQLRELGFEAIHPLWIVRRTMIDMIKPIEFSDMLRLRRWCSATSTRWCEKRVRIDGRKGGLIESEAFWININPDTFMPSRISDDFLDGLRRTPTPEAICALPCGCKIRHEDEKNRSAILVRILQTCRYRDRHPPRSLRSYIFRREGLFDGASVGAQAHRWDGNRQ
jgi:acyl-ACP thioesterase